MSIEFIKIFLIIFLTISIVVYYILRYFISIKNSPHFLSQVAWHSFGIVLFAVVNFFIIQLYYNFLFRISYSYIESMFIIVNLLILLFLVSISKRLSGKYFAWRRLNSISVAIGFFITAIGAYIRLALILLSHG